MLAVCTVCVCVCVCVFVHSASRAERAECGNDVSSRKISWKIILVMGGGGGGVGRHSPDVNWDGGGGCEW